MTDVNQLQPHVLQVFMKSYCSFLNIFAQRPFEWSVGVIMWILFGFYKDGNREFTT